MYTSYFGFREKPFNVTPDPRFVYMNPAFREAYASLLSGIRERKGFVVLTGEVGTGKTTLLRVLMKNLEATVRFVYFYNTTLSFEELLTYACEELGLETGGGGRLKKIQALNDFLIEQLRKGGTGALLIDEAQHLSEHVLENLRLLSNLETGTEKLLQIILVGQPELEAKLAQPSLRQFKQRVSVQCRIDRLKDREILPYIQFRLESVGSPRKDIFGKAAVERVAHYSNGIPRLINIICDNALTIAFATSQRTISPEIIEEVAGDLRLKEPVPSPALAPPRTPEPAIVRSEPIVQRAEPERVPSRLDRDAVSPATRRERGGPHGRRAALIAGGALAAIAAGGAAVAYAPQVIEVGAGIRAALGSVTSAAANTVTQAWSGVTSQVTVVATRPSAPAPAPPRAASTADTGETPRTDPGLPELSAPVASVERAVVPPPAAPRDLPVVKPPAPEPTVASQRPKPTPERSATPSTQTVAVTEFRARATESAAAPPSRPADQRPMVIPQGGTISDIAFRNYGQYSTLAVDLIKESNPHIADLDWIRAGDRLWLPPLTRETLIRPQPDGSYRLILASFLSPVAAERLTDGIRRRGLDARVTPRPVTGQLSLYRVEIVGITTRDAAESAWRTAQANCWVFVADAPCERTNP
jgi:type II secretory pathway predicted ATPase ExeA